MCIRDRHCEVAFAMARELEKPGVLRQEIWDSVVQEFGMSFAMAVVQYVGFYKYISTILNGFGGKVPSKA